MAAVVLAGTLVGCAGAGDGAAGGTATRAFTAMDTGMTVAVYAADQDAADEAARACEQRVRELDELLAPAGDASEIAQVNGAQGAEEQPVAGSAPVRALVEAALDAARRTDGAFDPTVYPLTDAWGFTDGDYRVPAPAEIATLLPRVGFQAVQVDAAANTVALTGGAQLDVGGVAKGFAADELEELLRKRGVTSALLDLGGNVTALGTKPDGSLWKVGIADPSAPDRLAGTLEVRDVTVSTSGAYQRFFDGEDGTRYHHLLDPATGYPAVSDLASATVIGADGAPCDALSTACFVRGLDGALDLWRAAPDGAFELVLIADDDRVFATSGAADSFSVEDGFARNLTVVERP